MLKKNMKGGRRNNQRKEVKKKQKAKNKNKQKGGTKEEKQTNKRAEKAGRSVVGSAELTLPGHEAFPPSTCRLPRPSLPGP